MANQVIYKHPSATRRIELDLSEELLDDTGLNTTTSTVSVKTSSGGIATGLATVSCVTTSMELMVQFVSGTHNEDYVATISGIGNTTARTAVRVIEMRVRENLGLGLK